MTLSSENDRTFRIPATDKCTRCLAPLSVNERPCSQPTRNSTPAPMPSVTTRRLSGGISSSEIRIAGHVRPHAKPSATSIKVAVESCFCCAACTPAPFIGFLLERAAACALLSLRFRQGKALQTHPHHVCPDVAFSFRRGENEAAAAVLCVSGGATSSVEYSHAVSHCISGS